MNPLDQLLQMAGVKPYDAVAARSTPPGMENLGTLPQAMREMGDLSPEQVAQRQRLKAANPGLISDLRRLAGLESPVPATKGAGGFDNDLGSFGAGMMSAGSRPGASFLGAVGEGLTSMAKDSRQRRQDELALAREERTARLAEEELGFKRQKAEQDLKDKKRSERAAALALVIPAHRPALAKALDEGALDASDPGAVYGAIQAGGWKLLPKLEKVGDRLVDTSAETPTVVLGAKPEFKTVREGNQDVTYRVNDDGSMTKVGSGAAFKPDKPDKPSETQQLLLDAGYKPGTPEHAAAAQKLLDARNKPLVSMNPGENEEQKQMGGQLVKEYAEIRDRAAAAQDAANQIQIARSIKAPAGALEPMKARVGAVAQALGFAPDTLSKLGLDRATDAQAFEGIIENLVLTKMQAQKGPQTENDARRIKMTVASISNTAEAQDFLMRSAQALASRDIEKHRFYDAYRAEKGTLDGASSAWRKEIEKRPLVGVNPTSKLPVFFDEFVEATKRANPGAPMDQILSLWETKYGK